MNDTQYVEQLAQGLVALAKSGSDTISYTEAAYLGLDYLGYALFIARAMEIEPRLVINREMTTTGGVVAKIIE